MLFGKKTKTKKGFDSDLKDPFVEKGSHAKFNLDSYSKKKKSKKLF